MEVQVVAPVVVDARPSWVPLHPRWFSTEHIRFICISLLMSTIYMFLKPPPMKRRKEEGTPGNDVEEGTDRMHVGVYVEQLVMAKRFKLGWISAMIQSVSQMVCDESPAYASPMRVLALIELSSYGWLVMCSSGSPNSLLSTRIRRARYVYTTVLFVSSMVLYPCWEESLSKELAFVLTKSGAEFILVTFPVPFIPCIVALTCSFLGGSHGLSCLCSCIAGLLFFHHSFSIFIGVDLYSGSFSLFCVMVCDVVGVAMVPAVLRWGHKSTTVLFSQDMRTEARTGRMRQGLGLTKLLSKCRLISDTKLVTPARGTTQVYRLGSAGLSAECWLVGLLLWMPLIAVLIPPTDGTIKTMNRLMVLLAPACEIWNKTTMLQLVYLGVALATVYVGTKMHREGTHFLGSSRASVAISFAGAAAFAHEVLGILEQHLHSTHQAMFFTLIPIWWLVVGVCVGLRHLSRRRGLQPHEQVSFHAARAMEGHLPQPKPHRGEARTSMLGSWS